MGKMGKGMETEFTKLCNTSGQESRQEWRTIIQRGKYTLGAWHRPTPRYQMEAAADPCWKSEDWKVTTSSRARSSENMFRKLLDSGVPCDPAVVIPGIPVCAHAQ